MKAETAALVADVLLDLAPEYQGLIDAAVSRIARRVHLRIIGAAEADHQEHEFYTAVKAGHSTWWKLTTDPEELDPPPPPRLLAVDVAAIARQLNRKVIDRILDEASRPPDQWRKK